MSEAAEILERARAREARRLDLTPRIDYARMSREWPKQKAALTRALKKPEGEARREAVLVVCANTVKVWDEIGCWPDDWSLFQRALDDVFPVFQAPRLEDLR